MAGKTCPYCGTDLEQIETSKYHCDFCNMKLHISDVKEKSERLIVAKREFPNDELIHRSTPEIMTLTTYELLFLLKTIRRERTSYYKLMNVFYKARLGGVEESGSIDYESETGQEYLYYTKKMYVFENIIRTRLGYVPKRITEQYLANYFKNILEDKRDSMSIRTERNKNVSGNMD